MLIDFRDARLGEKIGDWEQSGYPVRIECGERDIESGKCVIVSRISGEKVIIEREKIYETVSIMHKDGQDILLEKTRTRLHENVIACQSIEEIGQAIEAGKFAIYEWDQDPEFEKVIKEKFKATTRCVPFEGQFTDNLLTLKNPENVKVIIARNF